MCPLINRGNTIHIQLLIKIELIVQICRPLFFFLIHWGLDGSVYVNFNPEENFVKNNFHFFYFNLQMFFPWPIDMHIDTFFPLLSIILSILSSYIFIHYLFFFMFECCTIFIYFIYLLFKSYTQIKHHIFNNNLG